MPKFCKTEESHRMSIISNERFIIDLKVTSKGAPYTDTFIVYTREDYRNTDKGRWGDIQVLRSQPPCRSSSSRSL